MNRMGSTVPIHSKKACVVYDSASGRIRHVHNVVTFVGGREPTDEQIAADALQAVNSLPKPYGGVLQVLHIPHGAVEPGKTYRVDLNKKGLVPAL
jgi:hypothetical protein